MDHAALDSGQMERLRPTCARTKRNRGLHHSNMQLTDADQSSPQKRIPINSAAVTNTAVGQHNFIGDNLSEAALIGLAHVLELDQGLGDRLIARHVLVAKKSQLQ